MRFLPIKCNMKQLTRKQIKRSMFKKLTKSKKLGVTITENLRGNTHVSSICTKANRTIGSLGETYMSIRQALRRQLTND